MTPSRDRAVALRKSVSFLSFAAFVGVVLGGFALLGSASPAYADDQSRAIDACRVSVAQQVEGMTPASLGITKVGGGGRRYKIWLSGSAGAEAQARQFYCAVKRSGAVEEIAALNADGTPGQNLLASR